MARSGGTGLHHNVGEVHISHPQRFAKPKISGRFAAIHRERWCVAEKWTRALRPQCGLLVQS